MEKIRFCQLKPFDRFRCAMFGAGIMVAVKHSPIGKIRVRRYYEYGSGGGPVFDVGTNSQQFVSLIYKHERISKEK